MPGIYFRPGILPHVSLLQMKLVEVTRLLPVVKALKGFAVDVPKTLAMLLVENADDGTACEVPKALPRTPVENARLLDSCALLASATDVPNTLLPKVPVENAVVGTDSVLDGRACDVPNRPAMLVVENALLGWACEVPKTLAKVPVENARLADCCALLAVASEVPNTLLPRLFVENALDGVLKVGDANVLAVPDSPPRLPVENAELIPAVDVPKDPALPTLLPVPPVPAIAVQIAMPENVAMMINTVTAKRILLLTIL